MNILLHGNLRRLSSFSVVNRHLSAGLRRRGHAVTEFPSDDPSFVDDHVAPADVYLFSGHPWEARSAAGVLNVFVLNYEYLAPDRALRRLVQRLNLAFDLVIIPAAFLRLVVRAAGLRLPIEVVPHGFDPDEFSPRVAALDLSTSKRFVFLYAGAVNERKGVDLLLRAYHEEMAAVADVTLIVKEAPRHPSWALWAERLQRRYTRRARNSRAAVRWLRSTPVSLAPYFAAADVGVFPHRGEGFGLPILECIASGRRVIATRGTGPDAFCRDVNSWPLRGRRVARRGRVEIEPDLTHLRALLRRAYEHGKPAAGEARRIAASVESFRWQGAVGRVERVLERYLRRMRAAPRHTPTRLGSTTTRIPIRLEGRASARPPTNVKTIAENGHAEACPSSSQSLGQSPRTPNPTVAYAFHSRGVTSWKKVCTEIDRSLATTFPGYRAFPNSARVDVDAVDVAVGQSEHSLDLLVRARRRNPRATLVVHQECTVLADRVAIVNRERRRCGVPPLALSALHLWRNRIENELADHFIVASSVARQCFIDNGFDAHRIHVIPYGISTEGCAVRARVRTTRFLFGGTDPFRKGIRVLFAAWERAALRDAELICCTDLEVLHSKLLLGYLVRNPSITVRPLLSHRAFRRFYREIDVQVLPSLEDTFSVAIADGMGLGKPAIVSSATGVKDLIHDGVSGRVVAAGDVDALAAALHDCVDRQRLADMGREAYAAVRPHTWMRFRRRIADLMQSIVEGRAR